MTSCLDEFNSTTRLMAIKVIAKLLQVCGSAIEGMDNYATVLLNQFHATGLSFYPMKTEVFLRFLQVQKETSGIPDLNNMRMFL